MAVTGDQIVAEARKFLGVPYVYGGESPSGFDCSGLIQYVLHQLGVSFPRTADIQGESQYVDTITYAQLQPGDLIFSAWGSDVGANGIGHVSIYVGNGKMIVAPHTGARVEYEDLTPYYRQHVVKYGRVKGTAAGTGAGGGIVPASGGLGGILSFPTEIVSFFSEAGKLFAAFFQPATYIRLAAGMFGLIFLVAGLFFLIKEGTRR